MNRFRPLMLERAAMDNGNRPSKKSDTAECLARLLSAAEAVLEVYEEKGRLDFSSEQELEAAIEAAHNENASACRKQKTT